MHSCRFGVARGAQDSWLTRHPWLVLVPWLAFQVLILWKGGPLPRFLLIWMYLYLLPLAVAGVPGARYYFMATVPGAASWASASTRCSAV
jgi:hypothetical protein